MIRLSTVLLLSLLTGGICRAAGRVVVPFNTGWSFTRAMPNGAMPPPGDPSWMRVSLPHSWNVNDALPGDKMYRGAGWYRIEFAGKKAWSGRRVFIRFGAASLTAEVFLNGQSVGRHEGGFAAFCFELTRTLRGNRPNVLSVLVNNRKGAVSPLGGDFTIFGGLYRPAELVVTERIAVTPLDYAGPGVYLTQALGGQVEATVKVSNGSLQAAPLTAVITVLDAQGRTVTRGQATERVSAMTEGQLVQTLHVTRPHLWNGTVDPYLYSVRMELFAGRRKLDEVNQPLGFRTFRVDPEHGFVLNGNAIQIHGVNLHQDGPEGWARTQRSLQHDMANMREMGVTGVRLAHYQHSDYLHELCDRNGVLAWSELALVNLLRETPEFRANLRQQLTELIRQNYNHPSIVMWSMYNELNSHGQPYAGGVVKELNDLAHTEDPGRLTTGAASADTIQNLPEVIRAVDLLAINTYPGWYLGQPDDMGEIIDTWNRFYGLKGIAVSEYGAGGSVKQHKQDMTAPPDPRGRFHPEEWQAICNEVNYLDMPHRPFVWGSFTWVMFDFPSSGRHEGDTDGMNDKGLITRDRQVKKDAFYFYQANWTEKPMAYITSRRDTQRALDTTAIKVYSNCPKVNVSVNGNRLGAAKETQEHVFVMEGVALVPGENVVRVDAEKEGVIVQDICRWIYTPPPNP